MQVKVPRLARFVCHRAKATGHDGVRVRAGDTGTIWGKSNTLIVLPVKHRPISKPRDRERLRAGHAVVVKMSE